MDISIILKLTCFTSFLAGVFGKISIRKPPAFDCYRDICNLDNEHQFCSETFKYCRNCEDVQDDCGGPSQPPACNGFCIETAVKEAENSMRTSETFCSVSYINIANGVLNSSSANGSVISVGSELTFSCNEGYSLQGSRSMMCVGKETWDTTIMPYCLDNACPYYKTSTIALIIFSVVCLFALLVSIVLFCKTLKKFKGSLTSLSTKSTLPLEELQLLITDKVSVEDDNIPFTIPTPSNASSPSAPRSELLLKETDGKEPTTDQQRKEADAKEPTADQQRKEADAKEPNADQQRKEADAKETTADQQRKEADAKRPSADQLTKERDEQEPTADQLRKERDEQEQPNKHNCNSQSQTDKVLNITINVQNNSQLNHGLQTVGAEKITEENKPSGQKSKSRQKWDDKLSTEESREVSPSEDPNDEKKHKCTKPLAARNTDDLEHSMKRFKDIRNQGPEVVPAENDKSKLPASETRQGQVTQKLGFQGVTIGRKDISGYRADLQD